MDVTNYSHTSTISLDNTVSNEASGITYNWDTNSLFVIGDSARAVAQYSLAGSLLNSMTITGGFVDGDLEGISYDPSNGHIFSIEESPPVLFDTTVNVVFRCRFRLAGLRKSDCGE